MSLSLLISLSHIHATLALFTGQYALTRHRLLIYGYAADGRLGQFFDLLFGLDCTIPVRLNEATFVL